MKHVEFGTQYYNRQRNGEEPGQPRRGRSGGRRRTGEQTPQGNGGTNGTDKGRQHAISRQVGRGDPRAYQGMRSISEALGEQTAASATEEPTPPTTPAEKKPTEEPTSPQPERELPAPDPLGTVHVELYAPTDKDPEVGRGIFQLASNYTGEDTLINFMRFFDDDRMADYVAREGISMEDGDSADIFTEQYDDLKHQINENVYRKIQRELGLDSMRDAERVFEEQRQISNKSITELASLLYPGEVEAQLHNEVQLPQKPADLLELYLLPTSSPRLKFEIRRQFLDVIIGLQHERGVSDAADAKLTQIQNLLNREFYKRGEEETSVGVHALFDNETNELKGEPFFVEPEDKNAPEGQHYKVKKLPVRTLRNGTSVFTDINRKERSTSIRKALRRAAERRAKGLDGTVRIDEEVQDTHRMKIVVFGDEAQTARVASRAFYVITEDESIGWTGEGEIKPSTRNNKVTASKVELPFYGVPKPIKIVVQSLKNYLADEFEIGIFDPFEGEFTGNAHDLYQAERDMVLDRFIFPMELYPNLPHPYSNETWPEVDPHPPLEDIADSLRHRLRRRDRREIN